MTTITVTARLTDAEVRALDALREHLRQRSPWITRTDVIRFALTQTAERLEHQRV